MKLNVVFLFLNSYTGTVGFVYVTLGTCRSDVFSSIRNHLLVGVAWLTVRLGRTPYFVLINGLGVGLEPSLQMITAS